MELSEYGLMLKGNQIVADGKNPDKTRKFIALLRSSARRSEIQSRATTAYKAKRLMQNARQAREDANRIEATL